MTRDNLQKGITPRAENYPQWYLDIIDAAELAEHSVVKGCMVIKPYGYAIWENIQHILDGKFKETGHKNAYFPLFIPKSFLSKEAEHVEGFAKECAVVTHHRLMNDPSGKGVVVDPNAKLEEELIVRPTSETIIHATYSKWIQSWRDLPVLINQWANVVRFEMRTRLFLRTTEFLWQEGHTAHATSEEAEEETLKMYNVYKNFVQDYFALPVIGGEKSESERFAGADKTYCIEAMMQDKKALQAGTSHNLGQNFAKPFNIQFTDKDGTLQYVWQTSWGVSTRLIGALIMAHGDDKGLVLPPRIAPIPIVIIPIWKTEKSLVFEYVKKLQSELSNLLSQGIFKQDHSCCNTLTAKSSLCSQEVHLDDRDHLTPGHKFHEWEKKGVPLRIEVGPKDIEKDQVVVVRRDSSEKVVVQRKQLASYVKTALPSIQEGLFEKAQKLLKNNSHTIDDYKDFKNQMERDGGFIYSHWCGSRKCESQISEETLATIRCIPFDAKKESGRCLLCGKSSAQRVVFAKAY